MQPTADSVALDPLTPSGTAHTDQAQRTPAWRPREQSPRSRRGPLRHVTVLCPARGATAQLHGAPGCTGPGVPRSNRDTAGQNNRASCLLSPASPWQSSDQKVRLGLGPAARFSAVQPPGQVAHQGRFSALPSAGAFAQR